MSIWKQLGVSIAILVVVAVGWGLYDRPAFIFGMPLDEATQGTGPGGRMGGPGRGPAAVVVAPVEIDSSGINIRALGTAEAGREVTLRPQVTGIVTAVNFRPGSAVARGELLVHLEDDDERIAVDLAVLALESAEETLERAERLSESGSVTAVTLSDARRARQRASIDLRRAEGELANRTIRAPFDGVIGLSDVSVGDLLTSSTDIATVADLSSMTVSFDVPERTARDIKLGQSVTAMAPALPGDEFVGELTAIDNRVDATTRTLRVEATLPNRGEDLRPGMAVDIALVAPSDPQPTVPSLAIQWDRDGSYVWKLDGDTVARAAVQVISRRSGAVTVAGDLVAGDLVVVEGVLGLRNGQTVAPVGDPARPQRPEPEGEAGPVTGRDDGAPAARARG